MDIALIVVSLLAQIDVIYTTYEKKNESGYSLTGKTVILHIINLGSIPNISIICKDIYIFTTISYVYVI